MEITANAVHAVDISQATTAVVNAAVGEATRQAADLMGGHAVPGSPLWESLSGTRQEADRELAAQLLELRIQLAAGIDPLFTVVGLRRWGATWHVIARAVGISRQAAYERWGRRALAVLDHYGTGELGGPVADDEADLR
jgi:hypothetical protein